MYVLFNQTNWCVCEVSVKFYQHMACDTQKAFSVFTPWFKHIAIYELDHYHY